MPKKKKPKIIEPKPQQITEEDVGSVDGLFGVIEKKTTVMIESEPVVDPVEEPMPEPVVEENLVIPEDNLVRVRVKTGTLSFEQGTYQKGDMFQVTRARALLFDQNDVELLV